MATTFSLIFFAVNKWNYRKNQISVFGFVFLFVSGRFPSVRKFRNFILISKYNFSALDGKNISSIWINVRLSASEDRLFTAPCPLTHDYNDRHKDNRESLKGVEYHFLRIFYILYMGEFVFILNFRQC